MAKKRVTRKQLIKEPDEFLTFSGRAAHFVREHSQQFKYLGGAIAAALLIYLGMSTVMSYVNKKGQKAYNMAYYNLPQDLDVNSESNDLKQSEELFQKVINDYGFSKASRLALPELAYLKMVEKKYDEAIPLYQEFLQKASDNMPYQSLARMALAACYESKGEFERAIETLMHITAEPDNLFKEQAMLSLARVYRLADQEDKSEEILKEFTEKFTTSPFHPLAEALLNEPHS